MTELRLQKFLRDNLGVSRRKSEDLIKDSKVKVNKSIAELGMVINPQKDKIYFNNKLVKPLNKKSIYIMLNKPAGYLTSRRDDFGRKTVYDLLPKDMSYLFPVGRLDYDTEGLLLFTNDGDLAFKLAHPKFEVKKEYYVESDKKLSARNIKEIEKGINSPVLKTTSAKVTVVSEEKLKKIYLIQIHEGKNREVKKIFNHFGANVMYLRREKLSNLKLGNLKVGEWKEIKASDIKI